MLVLPLPSANGSVPPLSAWNYIVRSEWRSPVVSDFCTPMDLLTRPLSDGILLIIVLSGLSLLHGAFRPRDRIPGSHCRQALTLWSYQELLLTPGFLLLFVWSLLNPLTIPPIHTLSFLMNVKTITLWRYPWFTVNIISEMSFLLNTHMLIVTWELHLTKLGFYVIEISSEIMGTGVHTITDTSKEKWKHCHVLKERRKGLLVFYSRLLMICFCETSHTTDRKLKSLHNQYTRKTWLGKIQHSVTVLVHGRVGSMYSRATQDGRWNR